MLSNLRALLRAKSLIRINNYSFSSHSVCEILDEHYDDNMVELLTKKHQNLHLPKVKDEIIIINKVEEEIFPEIKTLYQGFTNKIQKIIANERTEIKDIYQILLDSISNKNLKYIYQHFDYNRKLTFPRAIYGFRDLLLKHNQIDKSKEADIKEKLLKLSAGFEYIITAHFLHHQIEAMDELMLKFPSTIGPLGTIQKYFNDGKILLAGDFFHTKASRLGSETGVVEISYFLSILEQSLAKAVIREEEIVNKIDKTNMKNLIYLSYHETAILVSLAFKSTYLLLYDDYSAKNEDLTLFSMHFGLAWHFISKFKEQYEIWLKLNWYKPYAIISFLESESSRLNISSKEETLRTLGFAHLVEAEKHLANLIGNAQEAKAFIKTLMEITEINKIELAPKLKI